jgi:hypothetical protein
MLFLYMEVLTCLDDIIQACWVHVYTQHLDFW